MSRNIFRLEDRENGEIPINHFTEIENRVHVLNLIRQNTFFPPQDTDSLVVALPCAHRNKKEKKKSSIFHLLSSSSSKTER